MSSSRKRTGKIVLFGLSIMIMLFALYSVLPLRAEAVENDQIINIPDPNLESEVRWILNKFSGDIYKSEVEKITELEAGFSNISNLEGLQYFTGLKTLKLYSNKISDISCLKNLTNLEVLYLGYNQISDVSYIKNLVNLKSLIIADNQISDISSLAGLNNLEQLQIEHNNIANIDVVKNMPNLKLFVANNNNIKDISSLSELKGLEELWIYSNQISDISALRNLTNLKKIDASSNSITSISALSNLLNLEWILFDNNQITDISSIANLTNLTYIEFMSNHIKDISPIANLINIVQMNLTKNEITSVEPLSGLVKLNILDIGENQITDVEPLKNLGNLNQLFIGYNKIKDISPINNITSLKWLVFSSNEVEDISSLKSLVNLEKLQFSFNQITNIDVVSDLPNLKLLDISENYITDISPLRSLSNINVLYMQRNRIKDISPLEGRSNLKILYLSDNLISDYTPVMSYYKNLYDTDFRLSENILGVIETDPMQLDRNAKLNQETIITFDEDIKAGADFKNIALYIVNQSRVGAVVKIEGNKLTVTPTDKLLNNYYYIVYIPVDSIESLTGGKLVSDYGLIFKVSEVEAAGIKIDRSSADLFIDQELQLNAEVIPENAENRNISWNSDRPDIASVDQTGKVKANKTGTAVITAKTEVGGYTTTCTVTVKTPVIKVTGVSLDKTEASLNVNERMQLTATIEPAEATNKNVIWITSDDKVATVDETGKVTAVGPGEAAITVTTEDGGYTAVCKVKASTFIPVTSIKLKTTSLKLGYNQMQKLEFSITPFDATNKMLEWSSSDKNAATVDNEGNVKGVGKGTAVITVRTIDGNKTASCLVSVIPVEKITLNKSSIDLKIGNKSSLSAAVYPSNAINRNIVWVSGNKEIAVVDDKGYVTGVADGTATIYARSQENSDIVAECKVSVGTPVSSIKLNFTSVTTTTLADFNKIELLPSILPVNAINKKVIWSSSNINIATVDDNGLVNAVGVGTVKITAKTESGNKTAYCTVKVVEPNKMIFVEAIQLTNVKTGKIEGILAAGKTGVVLAKVTGAKGKIPTNKQLVWETSDSSIASVDGSGRISAKAPGKVNITATATDGTGVSASVEIEVIQPITSISQMQSKTIAVNEEIELTALVLPKDITHDGISIVWSKSDRNGYLEFKETDVLKKDTKGNLISTVLEKDNNGNPVSKIRLKGLKKGTVTLTLTITTKDGTYKKVTCKVTVK